MHRPGQFLAGLALAGCLLVGGCASTPPPLQDTITRIPVSNKADIATGVEMEYFMGSRQGFWNSVACDDSGACWYSGEVVVVGSRTNPVVARMTPDNRIAWARTYQINQAFTQTFGLVHDSAGGALLYGNSVRSRLLKPAYEKLDANGVPEWAGLTAVGNLDIHSAFVDGIQLDDGGFALAGSNLVKAGWGGVVLRTDPRGNPAWMVELLSRGESTIVTSLAQLPDGELLAAGVDTKLDDIVIFHIARDGTVKLAPVFDIRGQQVPVDFAMTPKGPVLLADDVMPSGEEAAVLLRLDASGGLKAASRYRFVDGFEPYGVIPLTGNRLCLYGISSASDKKQSLALVVGSDFEPAASLAMESDNVFLSGAQRDANHIILAGGRVLGVEQHASGIVVTWNPALHVDPPLLAKFSRSAVNVKVHQDQQAVTAMHRNVVRMLRPSQLPTRLVSAPAATSAPHAPKAQPR